MKNIFSQTKEYVKQPNRNVFDLSFQNNGTYNFGTLYPVFCKEVIPGDSFQIDTQFALRFLPMAFPIQTRMRANLHFFYVRNRNLWDDWKKFIGHTHDTEFPYLDGSQDSIKTGGLADYLGIPTTVIGSYSRSQSYPNDMLFRSDTSDRSAYVIQGASIEKTASYWFGLSSVGDAIELTDASIAGYSRALYTAGSILNDQQSFSGIINYDLSSSISGLNPLVNLVIFDYDTRLVTHVFGPTEANLTSIDSKNTKVNIDFLSGLSVYDSEHQSSPLTFSSVSEFASYLSQNLPSRYGFILYQAGSRNSKIIPYGDSSQSVPRLTDFQIVTSVASNYTDIQDISSTSNPFITENNLSVPLSALPFRAYESIYNAFYRNEQNDPLMINGVPEYDKYCPNTESGSDSYPYRLYQRNWELDFLTSAVQSPQQGIAPLVGVSSAGDFTFVNKDSNGNIGYFTAKANLSSDGSSITGFQLSDKVELDGIPYTETPNSDVPDDVKRGTVYSLNQMALAGISINDFRNVNALQRWLETNIRRGYKYVDQIKSHFGVDVAYNVLDMPEFIGGVSEPVYINQVNQTTETETDPLGSYAGQASVMAQSSNSVRHYCDEHGFIIGIFSVVPAPNYSQLLPKHFIKDNYLDYFFPEFGHIGMQPIDYREVCPLQQYGVNPNGLLDTFGYQRAWYDYIASVDEVHGLFRTNLRNFVLNRQFDTLPKLNKDFLQVDPAQLNDVFTVQDISDKILGQIHFNVIAKRPIPKFGIPRLE